MKILFWTFLMSSVVFSVHSQESNTLFDIRTPSELEDPGILFSEIQQLILDNYYTTSLTEKDLYWAAIKGMLRHISPPENPELAAIWTAEEYEKILNSLKGEDVSLGLKSQFNANDGSLTITEIQENSSASGVLLVNDRILRVDGRSLKGMSTADVNRMLEGEVGSSVNLTINRDITIFDIALTRTRFSVDNLIITRLPGTDIALVEIRKIYQNLSGELEEKLSQLQNDGISNLILDLRNNTGGVLNEGIRVANLFLTTNNIIVRTMNRSEQPKPIASDNSDQYQFDLVVLINGNTASASEIIAAALQDHKRATLIGSRTYGKGVIETTYTLSNDYRVKFITNAMYRPTGIPWQAKGILPDFLVEQDQGVYQGLKNLSIEKRISTDIFLITAVKLLK